MTQFHQQGVNIFVNEINLATVSNKLTAGIYVCNYSQDMGFYLTVVSSSFDVPAQFYGSITHRTEKIVNTYNSRSVSTGILLTGDKGAGKTLLTQSVANKLIAQGLPVILINAPFRGDAFNLFINRCGECVLLFDEFSKVYAKTNDDTPQNDLLTLFDGVSSSKRLLLITENSVRNINEFMIARPGRLYYHFKYDKLEIEVVKEFCTANTWSTELIEELVDIYATMPSFSFDILKTIVEEHNRYPTAPLKELIEDLNIGYDEHRRIQLSIVKAVNKFTNMELTVPLARSIIDKPTNNSASYVSFIDHDGEEDRVTLIPRDLIYEKGARLVYEDQFYLVMCDRIDEPGSSYQYKSHL
jgi:hypothetical protein